MINSPFAPDTLFYIGPVPITSAVMVSWGLMLGLGIGCRILTRGLALRPGRIQVLLETTVGLVMAEIRDSMRCEPRPYLPLIGTLFIYILAANWSSLIPGVEPPTARLETDAALAGIVFIASIYFGIRSQGVAGYLRSFAHPSILMLPINLIEAVTRTLSLMLRLFGNIVSGVFVIGIIMSIAGLLVPIPLIALDLLTGAVQAYIFAILALIFISSATTPTSHPPSNQKVSGEAV